MQGWRHHTDASAKQVDLPDDDRTHANLSKRHLANKVRTDDDSSGVAPGNAGGPWPTTTEATTVLPPFAAEVVPASEDPHQERATQKCMDGEPKRGLLDDLVSIEWELPGWF